MSLKQAFKESFDKGDRWGSVMCSWFTVSNEINHREEYTPSEWGYRPSPLAGDLREHDDYLFEDCEQAGLNELIHFGNVLQRYARNLERIGESY